MNGGKPLLLTDNTSNSILNRIKSQIDNNWKQT